MNNKIPSYLSRRTALASSLCLLLGTGTVQAADWAGTFTMYGAGSTNNNIIVGVFPDVTGTEKSTLSSPSPFFGFNWTAHDLTTYDTVGTYTINTGAGSYTFTVASGEIYGHLLFDWNGTFDIDVLNKWTRTYDSIGQITYSSVDFDCGAGTDGTQGCRIFEAFPGFAPNFDMKADPAFAVTLSAPVIPFNLANQTFSTTLNNTDYSFDWDNNGTAKDVAGAVTTANTATLDVDGSVLTAGTEYTLSVDITRVSDSATVRADIAFTPVSLTLSASLDSDGDGIDDNTEGSADTDGDGIPDFLDHSSNGTRLMPIDSSSTTGRAMSSDSGVLIAGITAVSANVTNLLATTYTWNPTVTTTNIGTSDTVVTSSCIGGCYDFKVTGLTTGGTTKIVIPLSEEIPSNPVYRKFVDGSWKGFVIDTTNSISSAAATGTGRSLCPAAGSSSYSNTGLTPGHYCIQLTIVDGGPNDADGTANGIVVDPGGIAKTSGTVVSTGGSASSGCSISETPVKASERADWWLVAGFIAALAGLRAYRRSFNRG